MMNARWSFLAVPLLAALGCSDPVPLPAQGAVSLTIPNRGPVCPDSGYTYNIGNPTPPSRTATGDSLVDGKGASISCSVRPSGAGYAFSGTIAGTTTQGTPSNKVTVSFTSGVVDASGKGTANVSVFTTRLGNPFNNGATPCTITVLQSQVKPGSIWATFECASIVNPPDQTCGVSAESTIVFENCDGS